MNRLAEDTIMVERDSSKESLHNELKLASKISARLDMMHKKDMKKERNRVQEELRAATKKFSKERKSAVIIVVCG